MKEKKTIVFVGDSITEGAGDDEQGGWTRRLAARLPAHVNAIHAGVGGDTILLILNRLQRDVLAHEPQLIVLAVGVNDSRRHAGGVYEVALPDFERGLAEFAARLPGTAAQIAVVGLTPVDEPRTLPIAEDLHYTQIAVRDYDAALSRFAAERGFRYIPLLAAFAAQGGPETLTTDGLHPTPRGHEIIAGEVWAALEPLL
jgi:lysophospholipase L1-like esterase